MLRWQGELDEHVAPELERSALIVLDTQVDFADGGASPVPGTTEVLPAIAHMLDGFREARLPIVHVVRLYDGDDVDLVRRTLIASGAPIVRPHSDGSQIVPELQPPHRWVLDPELLLAGDLQELAPREWALWKPRWGAFHRTKLDGHLRALGITTVVIAGLNYPNCPRATVYGASERDYRIVVAADAVSGIQELHLEEAGRMGVVHAVTSDIAAQLATRAWAR